MSTRRLKLRSRTGCVTCRARKQKCDEIRPECGPCRHLRLHCIWRDVGTQSIAKHGDSMRTVHGDEPPNATGEDASGERVMVEKSPGPHSVDLSGFRDDICVAFTLGVYFKGCNASLSGMDSEKESFSVLAALPYTAKQDSISQLAFLTHSLYFAGARYHSLELQQSALSVYSQVLRRINSAIADEKRRVSIDTLAAINNTAIAANLIHPTLNEALHHGKGLMAIISKSKPEDFQSPEALRLLEYFRYGQVTAAMLSGVETVYTAPEWRSVPWLAAKHSKSRFQLLVDLVCDSLPIMASKPEMTAARQLQNDVELRLHRDRVISLAKDMYKWRLSAKNQDTVLACVMHDLDGTPDFSDETGHWNVHCQTPTDLYELCIFNWLLIELLEQMANDIVIFRTINLFAGVLIKQQNSALNVHGRRQLAVFDLPVQEPLHRANTAAMEILACFRYIERQGFIGAGSTYINVPMMFARDFLRRHGDARCSDLAQCVEMIRRFWSTGFA